MFKWIYWWKLSRKVKKNMKKQIEMTRALPPAAPPTLAQVEAFIKEMGPWVNTSHCISSVPKNRTYNVDINLEHV